MNDLHKRNSDLARIVSEQWRTIRRQQAELERAVQILNEAIRINRQLQQQALHQQERADSIARDMDELVGVRDG